MPEMTATSRPRTTTPLGVARRHWGALVGVGFAALVAADLRHGVDLAPMLAALAVIYLGSAALRSRAAAWPLFFAMFVVVFLVRLLVDGVDPTWVLIGLGALLAAYGLAFRDAARPAHGLPLQGLALLVLGSIAAAAPSLPNDLAGYLIAAALLAHAAWDWHHYRTERVVSRSLAEFCMVLDPLLAIAIVLVTAIP